MKSTLLIALLALAGLANATTYNIDPGHTYPSFEADHKGLSLWRGKFNSTKGTVTMDRAAKTGSVDITIDMNSIDFGHDKMNSHAKSPDIFNVEKFPTATYKGKSLKFNGDQLVSVDGELTMNGVTKPVELKVDRFKCIQDPRLKREVCGANATAEFKRTDFGINFGIPNFAPEVKLAIQVEAIAAE
ncbi:polyisoprenoid-binding protein YceI [Pseudoduganella flava]|uniref:Polyisoprenoid-binding protein n=1 Tax=Pseudoduganella flava TaxID=871742 RepID=A0A562P6U6_9BURK|nr:YceI family protein [Pseudoduganella flava]QGZ40024.1 polyisoprenoid-binding protein [Pseudoduganella flava]TWI40172.1 polyisoprenoid-binding protein YceI [Pseudoduganella flava]